MARRSAKRKGTVAGSGPLIGGRERPPRRERVAGLLTAAAALALGAALIGARTTPAARTPVGNVRGFANLAAVSPVGLPLGNPPLALRGLGDPAADPLHPRLANPPRAALLFNVETGQVLWQLNPFERLPIASLTKMMTALVTVRRIGPQAQVPITKEAVEMPGSKVGVLPLGKRMTAEALLYGLLLPSGNDAAQALATYAGPTVARFVSEMNEEAAALGLGCTRFSNPSGFYNENNFSCPADLAELAYVVLHQPLLARIVAAKEAAVPAPIKGGRLFLVNNNPLLLYGYPGTDGVKTGYTEAAGTSLVAAAKRDGVWLGVVLLHSPAPGTQAQALFDEAFQQLYHQPSQPEPQIPGGA